MIPFLKWLTQTLLLLFIFKQTSYSQNFKIEARQTAAAYTMILFTVIQLSAWYILPSWLIQLQFIILIIYILLILKSQKLITITFYLLNTTCFNKDIFQSQPQWLHALSEFCYNLPLLVPKYIQFISNHQALMTFLIDKGYFVNSYLCLINKVHSIFDPNQRPVFKSSSYPRFF